MRRFALFLVFGSFLLPAFAAKRVTVDQLEQTLTVVSSRTDAEAARQLADVELTERFGTARLALWAPRLPGAAARDALIALADASAFLDPPQTELPAKPAPDVAAQKQMLALTVTYVSKTIPKLPNFFATRETDRFEDTPQLQREHFLVPYQSIHRVGASSVTVMYRDGQEAIDTGPSKKAPPMTEGLNAHGVFGPILASVLLDAAQSKLGWSHWEQGPAGVEAVFAFEVSREKSHYEVNYCCVATESATMVADLHPYHRIVGYRGRMTIDPNTGEVLRLLVEADLKPTDPVTKAAILVDYDWVEIGGRRYLCPVKSISTALAESVQLDLVYKYPLAREMQPLKHSLSDVRFDQYHVFRAETRVMTAESEAPSAAGGSPASVATTEPRPGAETKGTTTAESAETPAMPPASAPAAVASVSEPPVAATPAPPPEPVVPEITVSEVNGVPEVSTNNRAPVPDTGFTVHTTARLVDVGVVALDKKGHPVTDLKPEDFELYDNGKRQTVRYYSQAGTEAAESPAPQPEAAAGSSTLSAAPGEFSNRRAPEHQGARAATESNITVLMIDAGNIAWDDLAYARTEMLRFLKGLPANERVGIYILRSYGFQVLQEPTPDHAQLVATLSHWMPTAQDLARAQDEEQRNRQHIDWVHNASDLAYVNGNAETDPSTFSSGPKGDAAAATHPPDAQLRTMGSNPTRDAMFILETIARHLAAVAGHKSLIWVSSDNALANWTSVAIREEKGPTFLDQVALRAREALNNANVSIYPLDVSQLEANVVTADLENANVKAINPPLPGETAPPSLPGGRLKAQMQQDTRPIQPAFRELADATGGRVFRRSGEIAHELDSVVADGRAAWLLSFTPDQAADNKYHLITVKLATRRDLTLHYRTGYQYDQEPATMKERIRDAIWKPADVTEIAMVAHPVASGKDGTIQLRIAATDVDLAQQSEAWSGKLDVFLVQRDDAGLHAHLTGQQLGLRLKPATYQRMLSEGIPFEVKSGLRPETTTVRVVAVDENSGRIGTVSIPAAALTGKP